MSTFENHTDYNCTITTDDGDQFNVFANWMHNQQLDQWQGWNCNAGYTRISIDKNGNVYSGECKNDFLGNVFDNTFIINQTPTICKRNRCTGCTDDLMINKQMPLDLT